ncbi:potassium channel family protein [Haliangium sp.]|uniref:potassium channel family protein n=1 Tax=Haliangium sp. TaxID=2663208 RepID=UPI003D0D3308
MNHSPGKRLGLAAGVLFSLTALGTVGYTAIEDLSLLNALYMTVITLSTVGYGEIGHAFSPGGRMFSIALIMTGLGATLYTIGAIAEYFLEGRLGGMLWRKAMLRTLSQLEGHTILCGYGRLGSVVATELTRAGHQVVVIDPDASLEPALVEAGMFHVVGSALEDECLTNAGIARARAIVITVPSDSDCVFVILSARQLNETIAIHARADTTNGARRMRMAGADQVISPHQLGGQRIANALLRPAVVDFIELSTPGSGPDIDMEELIVGKGSALDGGTIDALASERVKTVLVGVQRQGQAMRMSPGPEFVFQEGDRVVVVGERGQLRHLAVLLKGE